MNQRTYRRAWTLPAALCLLACVPATVTTAQQCPALVWSDEFDGSAVDTSKWSFQIGDGCAEGICGWGNNEEQSYQEANATVSGGTLKIEAREERIRNKQYTSARLRTLNQGDWTFGRFAARMKLPTTQGLWPAFWMLSTDEVFGGWPQSGEIDIMENIGSEPRRVSGAIHYGQPFPDNSFISEAYPLTSGAPAFPDDFYEFAVERQAGEIRWFVNDVLYAVRTPADTAPENWPFDERFHFLINVAVGGNFPGSPDATTVFPQILEVDWVRVYDGNFPHVTGDRVVSSAQTGAVYSVGNAPSGSSFSWTVPAGATIVSGQNTSSITVDWGTTSGAVVADVSSACGNESLTIDVEVEAPVFFEFSFENFDDPGSVTFDAVRTTGTLVDVANPNPSGVNTSALSGEYSRNSGEQFDVLFYDTSAISDGSQYVTKQKKFFMDVLTAAPVGTEILVQLENSSQATPINFPTGRHSRYNAFTTVQNQWERLEFAIVDQPDPGTPDGSIDDVVILFATNTFSGDVFTFDNFDSYTTQGGGAATTMHVSSIVVGTQNAGQGNKRGSATVTLVDNNGAAVSGATVTGTFTGDFNETVADDTVGDGTVTLVTSGTKKGSVSITFCVDDVTHATLTYDSASNVVTCGSL